MEVFNEEVTAAALLGLLQSNETKSLWSGVSSRGRTHPNRWSVAEIEALTNAARCNTSATVVTVDLPHLTPDSARPFMELLRYSKNIQKLVIMANGSRPETAEEQLARRDMVDCLLIAAARNEAACIDTFETDCQGTPSAMFAFLAHAKRLAKLRFSSMFFHYNIIDWTSNMAWAVMTMVHLPLTTVDLGGNGEHLREVVANLSRLKTLKYLTVHSDDAQVIAAAFDCGSQCSSLSRLTIEAHGLSGYDFAARLQRTVFKSGLTALNLHGMNLRLAGETPSANMTLKSADFRQCSFSPEALAALDRFQGLSDLWLSDIQGTCLYDADCWKVLSRMASLTRLRVALLGPEDHEFPALCQLLVHSPPVLSLSGGIMKYLFGSSTPYWNLNAVKALQESKALTLLQMDCLGLDAEVLATLGRALQQPTALEDLRVSHPIRTASLTLPPDDVRSFIESMATMPSIKRLALQHCVTDAATAELLVASIRANKVIQQIDLLTFSEDLAWARAKVDFYLQLNRFGRRTPEATLSVARGVWPHLFARLAAEPEWDFGYELIKAHYANAVLCGDGPSETGSAARDDPPRRRGRVRRGARGRGGGGGRGRRGSRRRGGRGQQREGGRWGDQREQGSLASSSQESLVGSL